MRMIPVMKMMKKMMVGKMIGTLLKEEWFQEKQRSNDEYISVVWRIHLIIRHQYISYPLDLIFIHNNFENNIINSVKYMI